MKKIVLSIFIAGAFAAACSCGAKEAPFQAEPTLAATVAPTPSPTTAPTPDPTPTPEPERAAVGEVIYRINCGGDEDVEDFVADMKFYSGNTTPDQLAEPGDDVDAATFVYNIPDTLKNPAPWRVYNSCRWAGVGRFLYNLDELEPGREYVVRLHFYLFFDRTKNNFDFIFNGTKLRENYDIREAAGGVGTAFIEEVVANADDKGLIEVGFWCIDGSCVYVMGIEVIAN